MLAAIAVLIGNYVIVQLGIILFMAPFYLRYHLKTYTDKALEPSVTIGQRLENFFSSKQANWLIFAWAAGEALFWFVIPEFLLLLLVFMRIRRKKELLFYDIYGTVAGTIIALALHIPQTAIAHLPYIQPAMITQTQQWYDSYGIFGLIFQPFSGVPFKVFTHLAADYRFFIPFFIIFAVVVRISRYFFAYAIFNALYPLLHKYVYRHYIMLGFIATVIFSILLYRVYSSYAI
jgi:membrane protein YqaA with SNARE-associated domain